jgi:hypothetical protein
LAVSFRLLAHPTTPDGQSSGVMVAIPHSITRTGLGGRELMAKSLWLIAK